MAKLATEYVFTAALKQAFEGIRQYERYPEYLPGVTNIEVLKPAKKGSTCQVRYEVNLIKTFHYVLNMYEEAPTKIRWELDDSNLMKVNNGSWELKAQGKDKTHARYELEIDFKGLVPSAVVAKVTKANMPAMFAGFQELIDDCAEE